MADVDSSESEGQRDNWVDFYASSNAADFQALINCHFTALDNFSANFIDFLKECLMMDVNARQTATSLLVHPVFRNISRAKRPLYTKPVLSFEKHYYR